ncbi:uncharacterized protein N7496_006177 [Penicillium cataractarum]|uniref:Uncharacterized protein n=1 Tax=Penicillium cataractarum TaxID=2100454 RepID=A0A9W9S1A8_9EURO|nr:uncharacterized protein N7496_006177 [Penicillium cataractarum]KAJ5370085.1 hypothetical protein N7496_006177 [Penicillium cataractarum]
MLSLLTTLGLRAAPGGQVPNHAASLLLANWFIAYVWMSTRFKKISLGIDNNVAPREDLAILGEAAVKSGKLSRSILNRLKREEAAHANAIEHFPVFVAATLIAVYAGVPNQTVNTFGVWYTVSRIAFSICYSYIETPALSYLRSAAWWSSNISCVTGLIAAAKKL